MFTKDQVLEALERAVDHYGPKWIDPNSVGFCWYTYGDAGGGKRHCIVGHVAGQLGVPVEPDDPAVEAGYDPNSGDVWVEKDGFWYDGYFEDDALAVLGVAQRLQDDGTPWGEVLEAVRELPL